MDFSLYLVTDRGLSRGRNQLAVVEAAIRGGVTVVQYREKNASTRRMVEEARELCMLCRAHGIPFIMNDRVDIALAVDADGVHVGQDDMHARTARALIGKKMILGVSAENAAQARRAFEEGADYIGASPVFSTPTKPDATDPIGMEALQAITGSVPIPVVAIGGINAGNAELVIRAGAAGVAVVSAIIGSENPENAARELMTIIARERKR